MSAAGAIAIRCVDVFTADLPLALPFRHASSGRIDRLEEIFLRITTADGVAGWGEVRGNAHYATGETRGMILAALADLLIPALLAAPALTPAGLGGVLDRALAGRSVGKALIDSALHDAVARTLGVPVAALLGGAAPGKVKVHSTVPFCAPEAAVERVAEIAALGVRMVKVRVGMPTLEEDLARLAAIRAHLGARPGGAEIAVAADANQGWTAQAARRALAAFEPFDLAFLEQPVASGDIEGLAALRRAGRIPIIADESVATIADALRLLQADAVDGFHFKLAKAGGLRQLGALVDLAEAARKPYLIGQMDEGRLATAAALHLAAARAPLSCELWGFSRVAADVSTGAELAEGAVRFSGPGLGITVDAGRLTHVATHRGAP